MTHEEIRLHLTEDVGLRLLQSGNAPLVLSFLHAQFKAKPRRTIPHTELAERLEAHLLTLREHEPDVYPRAAPTYLSTWCDEQHRYLRKYFEAGRDEPVYEPTPATERVLGWLGDLDQIAFVGTESRFLYIFDLLREIVQESTEDPDVRLERLEREQAALEAEIAEIRSTGLVERYNATQIRERFLRASDEARHLLADFRQVEANFRDVTRRVQERRLLDEATKGDLVEYVIDADDELKKSDQGRSFDAFWRFLISRAKKEEWQALLEAAYALPEVQALAHDHDLLRYIVRHLSEAGEKVVQSNRRLAEQLRRMLDEAHRQENRRVLALVDEVKRAALEVKDDPPKRRAFIALDGPPEVSLPMERPLWTPEETPSFARQAADAEAPPLRDVDLAGLFDPFAVEREQLEANIRHVLQDRQQATLAEVVDVHPVEKGLSEVIGYLAIASDDAHHVIDDRASEPIVIHNRRRAARRVTLPRVIFVR